MKKLSFILVLFIGLMFVFTGCQQAISPTAVENRTDTPVSLAKPGGDRIVDGNIYYSDSHYFAGSPIRPGFDAYGYNYQAHEFKGSYANVYLGGNGYPPYEGNDDAYVAANPSVVSTWYWPYRDVKLIMKWNDAWISNRDQDGDGKLDRHYGYPSYIGSGAWETNHQYGEYVGEDGETCKWNYFCKIVALPSAGVNIGQPIWGEFAIVQEVSNDQGTGEHGLVYKSPINAGFGAW
ncbi:hypothetical protein JXO52_05555 [bacterium]|nr:hypothetical protein [bacterium]